MSQSSRECVSLVLMWVVAFYSDYPSHRKVGNLLPACDWLYRGAAGRCRASLDMRGSRALFCVFTLKLILLRFVQHFSKRHR